MATTSYRLKYTHISEAADEILDYIHKRKFGKFKSLKTRWNKFNNICMGGIEQGAIYTIAGRSGSGKSSFANSLETDLFDLNPTTDFVILNFNFEMLNSRQVGRKLSYKMERTTSDLYSTKHHLSDIEYQQAKEIAEKIKKYPIYYAGIPGDVNEIRSTILHFMENEGKDKWVIVLIDHVLLTKDRAGEDERIKIFNLQRMFMEVKKFGQITIIQISQLNRDIESAERIANNTMHFPLPRDVFGADAIMQSSDYLFVLHRPQTLNILSYGAKHWPVEGLVYGHLIKNRDGEPGIIVFTDNLKYNRLDEADISEFGKSKTEDEISLTYY